MKIEVKQDCSLLQFVKNYFPQVSVTKAKKMILYNCFSIEGANIKSFEYLLKKGDVVEYRKYSGGRHIAKEKRDISVLYEDNDIVIVNKPAGVKVFNPKDRNREDMLGEVKRYVHNKDFKSSVYIIFAPETEESGLCIFSKNKYAFQKMSENMDKIYFGVDMIVCNKPVHKNAKIKFFHSFERGRRNISLTEKNGYLPYSFEYKTQEDLSMGDEDFFLIKAEHYGCNPLLLRSFFNFIGLPVVGEKRFDRQISQNVLKFSYSSVTFPKIINNKKVSVNCKLPNTFCTFNIPVHRTLK
ncbi:MAG: hypothetical protein IJ748_00335 [Bacteroidales bacterium]|nr:hypothetical protein [Bacteroidales bacterium]